MAVGIIMECDLHICVVVMMAFSLVDVVVVVVVAPHVLVVIYGRGGRCYYRRSLSARWLSMSMSIGVGRGDDDDGRPLWGR